MASVKIGCMSRDPLHNQIVVELRALRRGEGVHGVSDVLASEALTRVVGMGSPDQAFSTLVDMLKHHAAEPDSDIRAYLETCGLISEGDTLEKRLHAYAETHFVDDRTARRRSDRGAEALGTIFRDETLFFRPWGHLTIFQTGGLVFPVIALHMDPGSDYREPAVWINDETKPLAFDFEEPNSTTGYVRAGWHLKPVALRPQAKWLFKVDVEWRMSVWPQWVLGAQLADNRLVSRIQSQRNFMTEATVTWGSWPGYEQVPRTSPFVSFRAPPDQLLTEDSSTTAMSDPHAM